MLMRLRKALLAPAVATVVALVVSSIALLISGNNPVRAFREMWKVVDSTQSVVVIINTAVPYYVAGVAVAIGFKMNLFNIGADGQYRLATLFAAYVGTSISLPAPLHVAVIILVAVSIGSAWAAIPGALKVYRGVNEVISTIMLNYIATGLSAFLLVSYFQDKSSGASLITSTEPLPKSALLPNLDRIVEFFGFHFGRGVDLYGFLPFAILVGVGYYILLFRSRFGYDLRVSGTNAAAARTAGVNPKSMVMKTIMLSGAVSGLIGLSALLADPQFGHKYGDGFPSTLGFTGLSLALLGRNHPAGIAAAAFVWASIGRATQQLGSLGIPQEIGTILQGSFLLAAVIAFEVVKRRNERAAADAAARATHAPPPDLPQGALAGGQA
jgi:simple sugar transport system permease protein